MKVESKGLEIAHSVNIQAVQELVAERVKQITEKMLKALMSGLQEKLNFKGLAEKHISKTHNEEVAACDEKVQKIYEKLFKATNQHVKKHSQPLAMTFAMMNEQTGNVNSAGMFLGTFVLPEAESIFEKLKKEEPKALENMQIWQS